MVELSCDSGFSSVLHQMTNVDLMVVSDTLWCYQMTDHCVTTESDMVRA